MNIHRQQDQRTITTPNASVTPLATPRLGSQQTSVIQQSMPPGH